MNSLKLIFVNALTLVIGLLLISGVFNQQNANAARLEKIPVLQINKLSKYKGQYLTVLYAIGSRPIIATNNQSIYVSEVKEARSLYITGDAIELHPVQVRKEGFRPSYNMIILVVSPRNNYSWINANNSLPEGMLATDNHYSSTMGTVAKTEVDEFIAKNGDESVMQINLN